MTPKEKAEEIFTKMYKNNLSEQLAKNCSLIAINLVIDGNFGDGYDHQFWECVKEEIEKYK